MRVINCIILLNGDLQLDEYGTWREFALHADNLKPDTCRTICEMERMITGIAESKSSVPLHMAQHAPQLSPWKKVVL